MAEPMTPEEMNEAVNDPEFFKQYKLKKIVSDGLTLEERLTKIELLVNLLDISYNGRALRGLDPAYRSLFEDEGYDAR